MYISFFTIFLVVLAVALLIEFVKLLGKAVKATEPYENTAAAKKRARKKAAKKRGKAQATPNPALASRAPVFAEETDWSEYDEPAYLRKKGKAKPQSEKNQEKVKEANPSSHKEQKSNSQQQSSAPAKRQTPKAQMEDFRKNASKRRGEGATYQEV